MYMDKYNLHTTRPVGECFQNLVSNPLIQSSYLLLLSGQLVSYCIVQTATINTLLQQHLYKDVVKEKVTD